MPMLMRAHGWYFNFVEFKRKELSQSEESRQTKENQAILQMLLIVLSYMLGYIPVLGRAYMVL